MDVRAYHQLRDQAHNLVLCPDQELNSDLLVHGMTPNTFNDLWIGGSSTLSFLLSS